MRASVVVPTCRRPELLDRCLAALVAQDFDARAFEIIVADDAASRHTENQVRQWAARARTAIEYVPVRRTHGPAAARNAGWRAAHGEIIAFTDDDCIPEPGWLRAGVEAFESGVVAVSGQTIVPLPPEPTDYERDAAGLQGAEFVTANCFCRRDVLESIGGFDERFRTAWREDSDLHFALLERGGRIVKAPGALVIHPVRPAPWGVSLRQQRKALFNALLFKKHPSLYRERIQARPPWDYYAMVGALVLALAIAAGGHVRAAVLPALVWMALTARFCARRLAATTRSPGHVAEMVFTSILIPPLSVFWRLYGAVKFRVLFL